MLGYAVNYFDHSEHKNLLHCWNGTPWIFIKYLLFYWIVHGNTLYYVFTICRRNLTRSLLGFAENISIDRFRKKSEWIDFAFNQWYGQCFNNECAGSEIVTKICTRLQMDDCNLDNFIQSDWLCGYIVSRFVQRLVSTHKHFSTLCGVWKNIVMV